MISTLSGAQIQIFSQIHFREGIPTVKTILERSDRDRFFCKIQTIFPSARMSPKIRSRRATDPYKGPLEPSELYLSESAYKHTIRQVETLKFYFFVGRELQ